MTRILPHQHRQILAFYDAMPADSADPAAVASALSVSVGTVYAVLREHRPHRQRKPRPRTSDKRRLILGLVSRGHKVARVAELAKCSRTFVYRVLGEG